MNYYSDSEIWDACESIFKSGARLITISAIEEVAGTEVVESLIRESEKRSSHVTFRYPPIPCGAILAMGTMDNSK